MARPRYLRFACALAMTALPGCYASHGITGAVAPDAGRAPDAPVLRVDAFVPPDRRWREATVARGIAIVRRAIEIGFGASNPHRRTPVRPEPADYGFVPPPGGSNATTAAVIARMPVRRLGAASG